MKGLTMKWNDPKLRDLRDLKESVAQGACEAGGLHQPTCIDGGVADPDCSDGLGVGGSSDCSTGSAAG